MVNLFPADLTFGVTLWIGAFFLGGLGVAGQLQVVEGDDLKDDNRKQAAIWPCLADTVHRPDVHHRAGAPCHFPRS